MRGANRRASKYSAKLDPSSLAERVARFKAYQVEHARTVTVRLASLESRAKALMSSWNLPVPLVLHYLNYVRELYRALKTNTGWQARLLCYQLKEKWRSRGLDELKLFDLAYNLFHLKLWFHGAVLYLPFEAGRGTLARDYSNYGNNGTIYGAQWVAGKFGKALSFDGVDDYVEVPDIYINEFTIAMWIKPMFTTYPAWALLYADWHDGLSQAIHYALKGGKLSLYVSDVGDTQYNVDGLTTLPLNEWSHVAVTFKEGTIVHYLNGEVDNSGTVLPTTIYDSPYTKTIGIKNTEARDLPFKGIIDEVLIYPRALSEAEIKRLALP